jgi:hypothetical protein
MELKRLIQQWNGFPELSMEERPILTSDLEKIVVQNPLSNAFYLRKKLMVRIAILSFLLLIGTWQVRSQWIDHGDDLYPQSALIIVLLYTLYFHLRLLFFADYPTLLALPLLKFLSKLETILDKYIVSFKLVSVLAGFYLLFITEAALSRLSPGAYGFLSRNDWCKWPILVLFAVSFDVLLLYTIIPVYRRLLSTVSRYKEGIEAKAQNK